MKYIYIDHNILANEANWPLLEMLIQKHGLTLALSDWNLIEIAQATDRVQSENRMKFLESLSPRWFIPKDAIYKSEVRRFVLSTFYGEDAEAAPEFITSYTVSLSYDCGANTPVPSHPRRMVEAWQNDPSLLQPIVEGKKAATKAATSLKAISSADQKAKGEELFKEWVRPFIPNKRLNGNLMSTEEQEAALNHCFQNIKSFFDQCPSFSVEDCLTDVRNRDKARPSTDQDAMDLEHQLLALPHCDYLVTADGYIRQCAEFVGKSQKVAVTAKSIDALDKLIC